MLEQLYTIVNTRYEDGKAILLTTNLDRRQLRDQIGDRTVSRIYEMCGDPMPMYGADHRVPSSACAVAARAWTRTPSGRAPRRPGTGAP